MFQRLCVALLALCLLIFSAPAPARSQDGYIVANPPTVKATLTGFDSRIPAGIAKEAKFGFEVPQFPFLDPISTNYAYWSGVPQDPSLPVFSEIGACGFTSEPQATLTYPDASQQSVQLENFGGNSGDCWKFSVSWSQGMLLGNYALKIRGQSNTLSYNWLINYPPYKIAAPLGDDQYLLMGFSKNTNVAVRFYAAPNAASGLTVKTDPDTGVPISTYITTKVVKVDDNGAAILQIKVPPSAPFDVSDVRFMIDGTTATTWDSRQVFRAMSGDLDCPQSPKQQLSISQSAQVVPNVSTSEDYTAVHIAPMNQAVIGHITLGQTFTAIAGPICAPNWTWWKVQAGDLVGWMIEGKIVSGRDVYWIEPA